MKKYILCSLLAIFLIGINNANSQTTKFLKEFTNVKFEHVEETVNGFMLAGYETNNTNIGILAKTDLNGNIIWAKKYDVSIVDMKLDLYNGFVICGLRNNKTVLSRIDSTGSLIFSREYTNLGRVYSVESTLDRGFILVGDTSVYLLKTIVKTDSLGSPIHSLSFHFQNHIPVYNLVVKESPLGDVLVFAQYSTLAGPICEIVRFDSSLKNIKKRRQYGFYSPIKNKQVCFDGDDYIIATATQLFDNGTPYTEARVYRITDDLNKLNHVLNFKTAVLPISLSYYQRLRLKSVNILKNKSLIVSAEDAIPISPTLTYFKMDPALNVQWTKQITVSNNSNSFNKMIESSDGGLVGIGSHFLKATYNGSIGCYENGNSYSNNIYSYPSGGNQYFYDSLKIDSTFHVSQLITILNSSVTILENVFCFTGIEESVMKENSLFLYPNPTCKILNLNFENFNPVNKYQIEIVNILGQTVYYSPLTASVKEIDISSFLNGIYLLNLRNENGQITKRIIKN